MTSEGLSGWILPLLMVLVFFIFAGTLVMLQQKEWKPCLKVETQSYVNQSTGEVRSYYVCVKMGE